MKYVLCTTEEAHFSFKIRKQTIHCIFLSGGAWTSKKLQMNLKELKGQSPMREHRNANTV